MHAHTHTYTPPPIPYTTPYTTHTPTLTQESSMISRFTDHNVKDLRHIDREMYDNLNIAITCTSDDPYQRSDLYIIAVGHMFDFLEVESNATVENLNVILNGCVKMVIYK